MNIVEYERMAHYEKEYWWHIGRLEIIKSYLGIATKSLPVKKTKILNIGCGTGGTIDTLEQYGKVTNVDVSDEAIKFMKQHGYKNIKKVSGIKLPYAANTFDIVGAFDVLEHIKSHEAALKEWRRVLKPGGAIVLTVPAYKWLWSAHDTSLHHFRRYTTTQLADMADDIKLFPMKLSYAIVFSLPLVAGFRFYRKLIGKKIDGETSYVSVPSYINTVFTKLLSVEARMHHYISFPAGTSVVAILTKEK